MIAPFDDTVEETQPSTSNLLVPELSDRRYEVLKGATRPVRAFESSTAGNTHPEL
jgi:hypothetical protein